MVHKINTSEKLRDTLSLGDTNACRLIDGAGDYLPGIYLDDFAGRRLLSTSSSSKGSSRPLLLGEASVRPVKSHIALVVGCATTAQDCKGQAPQRAVRKMICDL